MVVSGLNVKLKKSTMRRKKKNNKKDFVAKTVDADLDFSDGFDKKPKKMKRSIFKKAKNFLGM